MEKRIAPEQQTLTSLYRTCRRFVSRNLTSFQDMSLHDWATHFRTDTWTYKFANGTSTVLENVAGTRLNFSTIQTGQDLFDLVDLPPPDVATTTAAASRPISSTSSATQTVSTSSVISSLVGYPSPLVIHPDGYTSGYFLPNSTIAVLAMQGFIDTFETDNLAAPYQQAVIRAFLNESRKAGMTKLIVDLQANGGGDIFSGFDAFKQLFPTIAPFGASRLRATPAANYMGEVFSAAGVYNDTLNTLYQFQSSLDVNNHAFSNWNAEDGPVTIYGDNFTQELRYNFSDPVVEFNAGLNVSGYLDESNLPPQLFQSEDIVLLYDGSCGSTCTVFSELMKAQGGVRSITLGGRPQVGPMQGVAGSKGAQVYTFGTITEIVSALPQALMAMVKKGLTPPALPPLEYIPNVFSKYPLGDSKTMASGSRFNLRNNMHDGDTTYTPLQFIYEASNCKLFYTPSDIYDISGLWERVAEVAWGTGKCVSGSSVNADHTFPANAYDTVPFAAAAYSTVVQEYQPGLLKQKSAVV